MYITPSDILSIILAINVATGVKVFTTVFFQFVKPLSWVNCLFKSVNLIPILLNRYSKESPNPDNEVKIG